MSEDSVRCFLGLPLDAKANVALDKVVGSLQAIPVGRKVRWVEAANRHITLAFLGNQSRQIVYPLQAALQQSLAGHGAFTLMAQAVSGFPDAKSAIVALELERSEPLLSLVADIQSVLSAQGLPVEKRAYRPHITLGRLRRGQGWKQAAQPCGLGVSVQSVVLYQSRTTPQGAQYTPLWSLPLALQ